MPYASTVCRARSPCIDLCLTRRRLLISHWNVRADIWRKAWRMTDGLWQRRKAKPDNLFFPFYSPLDYARFHSFKRHTHYFASHTMTRTPSPNDDRSNFQDVFLSEIMISSMHTGNSSSSRETVFRRRTFLSRWSMTLLTRRRSRVARQHFRLTCASKTDSSSSSKRSWCFLFIKSPIWLSNFLSDLQRCLHWEITVTWTFSSIQMCPFQPLPYAWIADIFSIERKSEGHFDCTDWSGLATCRARWRRKSSRIALAHLLLLIFMLRMMFTWYFSQQCGQCGFLFFQFFQTFSSLSTPRWQLGLKDRCSIGNQLIGVMSGHMGRTEALMRCLGNRSNKRFEFNMHRRSRTTAARFIHRTDIILQFFVRIRRRTGDHKRSQAAVPLFMLEQSTTEETRREQGLVRLCRQLA